LTKDKLLMVLAVLILAVGVGGFYYFGDLHVLARAGMVVAAVVVALIVAMQSAPGKAAWEFARASRTELRKVVWPNRRETIQTTLVVCALVVLLGLYIWLIDTGLAWAMRSLVVG
jgi:preprotein translocase subunit SecE